MTFQSKSRGLTIGCSSRTFPPIQSTFQNVSTCLWPTLRGNDRGLEQPDAFCPDVKGV